MRDFKRIKAWQRAHALSIAIHKLARTFARKGHGQLKSQLTRAASSIPTNIVEGCGAPTSKEFARYLAMSVDSANETEYHLLSARDLALIPDEEWEKLTAETVEVRKMIVGYRKRVIEEKK